MQLTMTTNVFPKINQVIKAEAWPKGHVAHVISVRRSDSAPVHSVTSLAL